MENIFGYPRFSLRTYPGAYLPVPSSIAITAPTFTRIKLLFLKGLSGNWHARRGDSLSLEY